MGAGIDVPCIKACSAKCANNCGGKPDEAKCFTDCDAGCAEKCVGEDVGEDDCEDCETKDHAELVKSKLRGKTSLTIAASGSTSASASSLHAKATKGLQS